MSALRERLLEVFEVEYREHVEAMRAMLAHARAPGAAELNEATRRAHTLKGAARAVGLPDVEGIAHGLESLFAKAKAGDLSFDADIRKQVTEALDEIEDTIASSQSPAREAPAHPYAEDASPVDEVTDAKPASVRVGAIQIDELFKSAGELQTDLLRQRAVDASMHAISREIGSLAEQWSRARQGQRTEVHATRADEIGALIEGLGRRARASASAQTAATAQLRGHVQRLDERVRSAGMLAAESMFGGFRKMVRDLATEEGKEVAVILEGLDCQANRLVLQRIKDPVMHLLRNAVSHGIEPMAERRAKGKAPEGRLRLAVAAERGRLSIVVEDDGRGVDFAAVAARAVERGVLAPKAAATADRDQLARLLFEPGFSTAPEITRISGRGVGLSVARDAVNDLDGTMALQAIPDGGTRIELSLPLSIVARRLLLVSFRDQRLAVPCDVVVKALRVPLSEVVSIEGRPALRYDDAPVVLRSVGELLDLPDVSVATDASHGMVLLLRGSNGRIALAVEAIESVGDFAVRPLDVATGEQRFWSGVTLAADGLPCLVLGSGALAHLSTQAGAPMVFQERARPAAAMPQVLVVDDSVTTRTLEKSILEAEGYRVRLSVDGADAIAQLRAEPADLVVSDIEMPRLDGFELLRAMKEDERLAEIPVILVTSREDAADRERGLQLGADAYVVKQKFDQVELLKAIRQMI